MLVNYFLNIILNIRTESDKSFVKYLENFDKSYNFPVISHSQKKSIFQKSIFNRYRFSIKLIVFVLFNFL